VIRRISILSLAVLLPATALAGAEEETSPWETALKATSSVLGAGRDYAEAIGDAKKLRPSDFNRLVYGNTAARKQLANRTNQWSESCKGLAESKTGQVIKWGSKISEGGATLTGQLSAGDLRGATATAINTQMEDWSAAGGAALGAKMLGGVGLLVGGPIGGMVGGAVGGVAGGILAVAGYDAYLAPWVERTVDQVWADKREPLQKALDTRAEFEYRQRRLDELVTEQAMLMRTGYQEGDLAETRLRLASDALLLPPDGKLQEGLIPRNCVIKHWNPQGKFHVILYVREGRVSARTGESLGNAGRAGRFDGHLDASGSVIKGGWHMADGSHSKETWTFKADQQVHISITWYFNGKPFHGTVNGPWHLVRQ